MATVITSHTIRIAWQRVSFVDNETYVWDFNGLITGPDIIDAFEKAIRDNTEFTNVTRNVRTIL